MPQIVEVDGIGEVEFPDEFTPAQIKATWEKHFKPQIEARRARVEAGRAAAAEEPISPAWEGFKGVFGQEREAVPEREVFSAPVMPGAGEDRGRRLRQEQLRAREEGRQVDEQFADVLPQEKTEPGGVLPQVGVGITKGLAMVGEAGNRVLAFPFRDIYKGVAPVDVVAPWASALKKPIAEQLTGAADVARQAAQEQEAMGRSMAGPEMARTIGAGVTSLVPVLAAAPLAAGSLVPGIVAAGLQGAGSTLGDAEEAYRKQGYGPEEAYRKAIAPAIASGLVTALITKLGGATGPEAALKMVKSGTWGAAARKLGTQMGAEAAEEFWDQLGQAAIAKASYQPDITFAEAFRQAVEAGVMGAIIGGGMHLAVEAGPRPAGPKPPPLPTATAKPPPLPSPAPPLVPTASGPTTAPSAPANLNQQVPPSDATQGGTVSLPVVAPVVQQPLITPPVVKGSAPIVEQGAAVGAPAAPGVDWATKLPAADQNRVERLRDVLADPDATLADQLKARDELKAFRSKSERPANAPQNVPVEGRVPVQPQGIVPEREAQPGAKPGNRPARPAGGTPQSPASVPGVGRLPQPAPPIAPKGQRPDFTQPKPRNRIRGEAAVKAPAPTPLGIQREPVVDPDLAGAIQAVREGYQPVVEAQPEAGVQKPTVQPPTAKETFEERTRRLKADKEAKIKAVVDAAGEDGAVELEGIKDPERKLRLIITPDPAEAGKWRVTAVDKDGPYGHHVFDSRDAAVRAAAGESFSSAVKGPSYYSAGDFQVTRVRPLPKPSAAAMSSTDQLLAAAEPFTAYGENYDRNIAAQAQRVRRAIQRGLSQKLVDHEVGILKLRLDAKAAKSPPAQSGVAPVGAERPSQPGGEQPKVAPEPPAAKRKRVARGLSQMARFNAETERLGPDILSWIIDSGLGLQSKTEAKKRGNEYWSQNKGDYDGAVTLALPYHNIIYRGTRGPDRLAQDAYEANVIKEPTPDALWQAISDASRRRRAALGDESREEQFLKEEAAAHERWMKATETGAIRVDSDELQVGDLLEVEGERVEVVARDAETGAVTLKDGRAFETQILESGQTIYVEKWTQPEAGPANDDDARFRGQLALAADSPQQLRASDVDRVLSDDPFNAEEMRAWLLRQELKPETREAVANWSLEGAPAAPAPPQLRTGEKGTGDLFQGEDAPFNLAGETAVDNERIAREREQAAKDAAEAKRIADEQQVAMPLEVPPSPAGPAPNVLVTDAHADAIRARIKRRLQGRSGEVGIAGGLEHLFADAVMLGAYYIEKGYHRFADWSARMVEDFGAEIEQHLKNIYDTARITIESPGSARGGGLRPGLQHGLRPPADRIVAARPELTKPADESVIPPELVPHLDPHQRQGVATALRSIEARGGFLLADGTGAGKTRQAIAVAHNYARLGMRVVIVTKAETIKQDWKKKTFGGSYAYDSKQMGVPIRLAKDGAVAAGEIGITTYQNLADVAGRTDGNTVLIFDEAHALKNDSQQAKHGARAIDRAKHAMFMSATPADKPVHIYYLAKIGVMEGKTTQRALMDLGMTLITKRVFDREAGRMVERTFWAEDQRVSDADRNRLFNELFDRMTANGAMLKREISMDGTHVQVLKVALPQPAHDLMQDILEFFGASHIDDLQGLQRAQVLGHQRRQQEPFKIAPTVLLAKRELDAGRQVVIFVSRVNLSEVGKWVKVQGIGGEQERIREVLMHSEGTAKSLREALEDAGIHDIAEIHGNAEQASLDAMADFQTGRKRVVIATIESGGTGINLDDTVGNRPRSMIVVTAPFDAVGNVQAAGRIWRLKTLSASSLYYLFGNTAVDDWNADIIGSKMRTLGAVVEGQVRRLDVSNPDTITTDDYHDNVETASADAPNPTGALPLLDWKPFKTKAGKDKFVAPATKEFWDWYNANGKRDNSLGLSVSKWQDQWQVWSDKPVTAVQFALGSRVTANIKPSLSVKQATAALNPFGFGGLPPHTSVTHRLDLTHNGRGVRGWYDPNTGEIYLNAAYLTSPEMARATFIEEAFHAVQNDPAIQAAVDRIYASLTPEQLAATRAAYGNTDAQTLRYEAVADVLEKESLTSEQRGLLTKLWLAIKDALTRWLGKVNADWSSVDTDARTIIQHALEAAAEGRRTNLAKGKPIYARNAVVVPPGARTAALALTAYHGTPHTVDRFSASKIGTGEGAQVYGWGLYFAENPKVADDYAEKLGGSWVPNRVLREYFKPGAIVPGYAGLDRVISFNEGKTDGDWTVTVERVVHTPAGEYVLGRGERERTHRTSPSDKELRARGLEPEKLGRTYTVTLNVEPEELLDWDKPLSEQSEKVRKRLRDAGVTDLSDRLPGGENLSGAGLYAKMSTPSGKLSPNFERDEGEVTSRWLANLGVKGIRYLDQGSRGNPYEVERSRNRENKEFDLWDVVDNNAEGAPVGKPYSSRAEAQQQADALNAKFNRTYNYVIFNEADITITHANGQPVSVESAQQEQSGEPAPLLFALGDTATPEVQKRDLYENLRWQTDPARVAQDLQRRRDILRGTTAEIQSLFAAAYELGLGQQGSPAAGLNQAAGGVGVSPVPTAPGVEALKAARILLPTDTAGPAARQNAEILARRFLQGARGAAQPVLQPVGQADFVHRLGEATRAKLVFREFDEEHKDRFAQRDYLPGVGDFISINTLRLGKLDFDRQSAAFDAILSEELLHMVAGRVASPGEIAGVWNSLSQEEQARTRKAYDPDNRHPDLTAEQLGHEYVRMILQQRLEGRVTEETAPLTQQFRNLLRKVLDYLYAEFGRKPADSMARQVIERIEAAVEGKSPMPTSAFAGDALATNLSQASVDLSASRIAEMGRARMQDFEAAAGRLDQLAYDRAGYTQAKAELHRLTDLATGRIQQMPEPNWNLLPDPDVGVGVPENEDADADRIIVADDTFTDRLEALGVDHDRDMVKAAQAEIYFERRALQLVNQRRELEAREFMADYYDKLPAKEQEKLKEEIQSNNRSIGQRRGAIERAEATILERGGDDRTARTSSQTVGERANEIQLAQDTEIENRALAGARLVPQVQEVFGEPGAARDNLLTVLRELFASLDRPTGWAQRLLMQMRWGKNLARARTVAESTDPVAALGALTENQRQTVTAILARLFQQFDAHRRTLAALHTNKVAQLSARIQKLKQEAAAAQEQTGNEQVLENDIRLALEGQNVTGTLQTQAEIQTLLGNLGAVLEYAKRVGAQFETNRRLYDQLTTYTGQTLPADVARTLGLNEQTLQTILDVTRKSPDFNSAVTALIRHAAREVAGMPAVSLKEIADVVNADKAAGTPADKVGEAVKPLVQRMLTDAQAAVSAAKLEQRRVARELADLTVQLRTLELAVDLFDSVAGSSDFNALRSHIENRDGAYTLDMVVDNPSAKTFLGFGTPGKTPHAAEFTLQGIHQDFMNVRAAWRARITDWMHRAQDYVDAYETALARYQLSPGTEKSPSQLGFDAPTARGLKLALQGEMPLLLTGTDMDPLSAVNNNLVVRKAMAKAGWLFRQHEKLVELVGGVLGQNVKGYYADWVNYALRTHRILKQFSNLDVLRSDALRSHPSLNNDLTAYDQRVFQPMANEARQFGTRVAAGYTLANGETVTKADMDYLRRQVDFFNQLRRDVTEARSDRGIRENVGGRTLTRAGASPGDVPLARTLDFNRGNGFVNALVYADQRLAEDIQRQTGAPAPLPTTPAQRAFNPTATDLTLASTNPLVQFWHANMGSLLAHLHDAGRTDRSLKLNPLMQQAEVALARDLRSGTANPNSLAELARMLAARLPGGTGVNPLDFVTRQLGVELDQYLTEARDVAETETARAKNSGAEVRISTESEFTKPAALLRLPSNLYQYGAVSDGAVMLAAARANHDRVIDFASALLQTQRDINEAVQYFITESGNGPLTTAREAEIFADYGGSQQAAKEMADIIKSLHEDLVNGYDSMNAATVQNSASNDLVKWVVGNLLASPTVGINNLVSAGIPQAIFTAKMNRVGTVAALYRAAKNHLRTFPMIGLATTNWLANKLDPKLAQWLKRPANARIMHGLITSLGEKFMGENWERDLAAVQRLGFSNRDKFQERFKQIWREVSEYSDVTEQRAVAGSRLRRIGRRSRATLRTTTQGTLKLGVEMYDQLINVLNMAAVREFEESLRKFALEYGAKRERDGLTTFDLNDTRWHVLPGEWSRSWTRSKSEGGNALGMLKAFLAKASGTSGLVLEKALWDYYQAQKTNPQAELLTSEQFDAIARALLSEWNASTPGNRPSSTTANPWAKTAMLLQGYSSDLALKMTGAFAGTRGQKTGEMLVNSFGTLVSILVIGTLLSLVSQAEREWWKRKLQGVQTKNPTLLDAEFWTDPVMAAKATGIAAAAAVPYLGSLFMAFHDVQTGGKGYDVSNQFVLASVVSKLLNTGRGLYEMRGQPEYWHEPVGDLMRGLIPGYKELAFTAGMVRRLKNATGTLQMAGAKAGIETPKSGATGQSSYSATTGMKRGIEMAGDKMTLALREGETAKAAAHQKDAEQHRDNLIAYYENERGLKPPEARAAAWRDFQDLNPLRKAFKGKVLTAAEFAKLDEAMGHSDRAEQARAALADFKVIGQTLFGRQVHDTKQVAGPAEEREPRASRAAASVGTVGGGGFGLARSGATGQAAGSNAIGLRYSSPARSRLRGGRVNRLRVGRVTSGRSRVPALRVARLSRPRRNRVRV